MFSMFINILDLVVDIEAFIQRELRVPLLEIS